MKPKHLTASLLADSKKVISMGCEIDYEQCPALDIANVTDWEIPDPFHMDLNKIREVRETIKEMVVRLVDETTC